MKNKQSNQFLQHWIEETRLEIERRRLFQLSKGLPDVILTGVTAAEPRSLLPKKQRTKKQ